MVILPQTPKGRDYRMSHHVWIGKKISCVPEFKAPQSNRAKPNDKIKSNRKAVMDYSNEHMAL